MVGRKVVNHIIDDNKWKRKSENFTSIASVCVQKSSSESFHDFSGKNRVELRFGDLADQVLNSLNAKGHP